MTPRIEKVTESVSLGEAPHWDHTNQSLYFVDVLGKTVNKFDPQSKTTATASVGDEQVSFIIPVLGEAQHFVISLGKKLVKMRWDGKSGNVEIVETLAEVDGSPDKVHNRFNDAKCDPSGRLWAGTLNTIPEGPLQFPAKGTLYSLDHEKKVKTHLENLRISNGMCWNKQLEKMYFIDSSTGVVEEFDYDDKSATIKNRKTLFTLNRHNIDGIPDGMTIDADGNLWVALFNGFQVIKIDGKKPETLLNAIPMPVKQVTSVAFGGLKLDELYVTTGAYKMDNSDISAPENGCVFRISNLGTRGVQAVKYRSK